MKRIFLKVIVFAFIPFFALSCDPDNQKDEKEEISYEEKARRKTHEATLKYLRDDIMKNYYYWYDQVPNKTYTWQTDIYDYFDALLVKQDRWSWMIDGKTYMDSETGVLSGTYGVALGQPKDHYRDYGVYIRFVYPGGPFDLAGVKRGWEITAIDKEKTEDYLSTDSQGFNDLFNYPSTTRAHTFTFRDPEGNTHTETIIAAESLNTRPGLVKKIFTADDYPGLSAPVGYFHYLSFKADNDVSGKSMLEDITEAMDYFKNNNVKTLILDLRYNGGGDSRASDLLVSYLAPASAVGQVYVKRTHNKKLSSYDAETKVKTPAKAIEALEGDDVSLACKPDSPEFEHLYFITGAGSASASEMTLNGLKPLANLQHVGSVTYGKPNGMYVFLYPEHMAAYDKNDYSGLKYVFLPICFYNANGIGQNIPDTGLVPDNKRPDDLYHDFGVTEDNIAACLYHIVNGTYPDLPEAKPQTRAAGGIDAHLNEYENNKNYGLYTVKPDFF